MIVANPIPRKNGPIKEFYITNVFWGEEFRRYFLNTCLPSLLWPLNRTARAKDHNTLLIVTTREDWKRVMDAPITAMARHHYNFEWMELPSGRDIPDKFLRCAEGYRVAAERLASRPCAALHLSPDLIVGDGTLPELFARRAAGAAVVVVPVWRSELEGIQRRLSVAVPINKGLTLATDRPIRGRELARVCADAVHSFECDRYWDGRGFRDDVGTLWWRVPGDDGWLMHAPTGVCFIDYGRIDSHEVSGLRNLPFDAYPSMFKPTAGTVETARDSDSLFIASFTPADEAPRFPSDRWQYKMPVLGQLTRGLAFRLHVRRMFALARNEVSLRALAQPFRVHTGDLTKEWDDVAMRAARIIAKYVGDLIPGDTRPIGARSKVGGIFLNVLTLLLLPSLAFSLLGHQTRAYGRVIWSALCGDATDRRRIFRRLGLIGRQRKAHRSEDVP